MGGVVKFGLGILIGGAIAYYYFAFQQDVGKTGEEVKKQREAIEQIYRKYKALSDKQTALELENKKEIEKLHERLADLEKRYAADVNQTKHLLLEQQVQYSKIQFQLMEVAKLWQENADAWNSMSQIDEKTFEKNKKDAAAKLLKIGENMERVKNLVEKCDKDISAVPEQIEANIPKNNAVPPKVYIKISKTSIVMVRDRKEIGIAGYSGVVNIIKTNTVYKIIITSDVAKDEIEFWRKETKKLKIPCEIQQ